jgi:carboxypeptidase Q
MRPSIVASLVAIAFCTPACSGAQGPTADQRAAAERLIDAALADSAAHRRLSTLADRFGHRMSGSESLERSLDWIMDEMRRDGLENVHAEPVMVTHWVRGAESLELVSPRRAPMRMLGLGRSVGTPASGITAPVIVVRDWAELRTRAADVRGKIVVFNYPFDTTLPPFTGYGQAVQYRANGADSATRYGAVAALVRSVTPKSFQTPHTGGMSYADSGRTGPRIPGAAITVEDAEMLRRMQERGERIVVTLRMEARMLPPAQSRNVVAEIRGSERPDEIIVLGGHIDSWDVGQGAMDDAGGSVAAWEAVRLIRQLGVRPKRTVRVVLWTNEEIGLAGANAYRDAHRAELDKHILAMESDNGVFRPHGLYFAGPEAGFALMRQLSPLLARIGADSVAPGGPQADVSPLYAAGVPTLAPNVDVSRYFWYHHTEADTPDKIDPLDMARCVALMAVMANAIANLDGIVPRPRPAGG